MNLFEYDIPDSGESFSTLFEDKNIRVVRIVSSEDIDSKLYNQKEDEWIVLLNGEASLDIDGDIQELKKGDTLFIPTHTPHRVLKTKKGTLWLSIYIFNK